MKHYLLQSAGSRLSFHAERGRWTFRSPEGDGVEEMATEIEIDGEMQSAFCGEPLVEEGHGTDKDLGAFVELTVTSVLAPKPVKTVVNFRLYHGAFLTVSLAISNPGPASVTLSICKLFCGGSGAVVLPGDPAEIRLLCLSAWVVGNAVRRVGEGRQQSRTVGLLYHPSQKRALNCSFLTFDRAATEIIYTDEAGRLSLEGRCDFAGFVLEPGATTRSERAALELSADPMASLERWADRAARYYKPRFAERPSIGWLGGWTWRDGFSQETYENIVLENITAITSKLGGFGVQNIWVSIANIKEMLPGLWMEENAEAFPHGFQWLVSELKRHGMKLGFWIAPFWIPDKLCDLFEAHRGNLLKQGDAYVRNNYQFPYGASGNLPEGERVGFYSLDGSHPRSLEFLREVFDHYRRLGVRYFMIDFLYAGSGSTPGHFPYDNHWDRTKIRGPEVYRQALNTIREAAGEETYLLSSTGTTFQNVGCVDAVRVGPDIGEGRPLIKTMAAYPATYRIRGWELIQLVASAMAHSWFTDRRLFYNDAFNVLTVDQPVPLNEARATVSMFALSSGPVMLGDDIATISSERLSLVKKCLPQYQMTARAVDLFSAVDPVTPKVFHLHVAREWDEWEVVGILNAGAETLYQLLDFEELGLQSDVAYMLFDFWNESYLGDAVKEVTLEVPVHSVKVVRICRAREHPWLLSSDMHVTQGAVEVSELRWDAGAAMLEGVCTRPAGETGNLYFLLPAGWKPVSYAGLNVAKDAATGAVIAMKRFHFEEETVSWQIAMECYLRTGERDYAGI